MKVQIQEQAQTRSTKTEDLEENQRFKKFSIYADMSKVDRTWERYGYLKAPLAVRLENGELSSRSHKSQLVIHNDDYKKIVSNMYAVTPNEFIDETLVKHVLKNLKDLKMHIEKTYTAHDGDSQYWVIVSDDKVKIDGDDFQFGVTVRNGLGTNVSLGADLYSFRLVCTNGAIMRGKNFGSFSIAHIGKAELIAKYFETFIRKLFGKKIELERLYNKIKMIKTNNENATTIYKHMPFAAAYLPTTWNILSRYDIKDLKEKGKYREGMNLVEVTTKGQNILEVFNQITEKQRDGLRTGRINFAAVSTHQIGLHNALLQIANTPKRI